jgi:hypothetical protein
MWSDIVLESGMATSTPLPWPEVPVWASPRR